MDILDGIGSTEISHIYISNRQEEIRPGSTGKFVPGYEAKIVDDKFFMDEEGFFYYVGRSNDMLKVGGIWVSPIEVEACLIGHPAVLECAVVPGRAQSFSRGCRY